MRKAPAVATLLEVCVEGCADRSVALEMIDQLRLAASPKAVPAEGAPFSPRLGSQTFKGAESHDHPKPSRRHPANPSAMRGIIR